MNRADRVDFHTISYVNDEKTWKWIQEQDSKRMAENPICEICKIRPTTRITGLGTLKACCYECNEDIYKYLQQEVEEQKRVREEWKDRYGCEYDEY